MSSSLVEIKGLVKKYGDRIAVNGVALSILEGEIFGAYCLDTGPCRTASLSRSGIRHEKCEGYAFLVN